MEKGTKGRKGTKGLLGVLVMFFLLFFFLNLDVRYTGCSVVENSSSWTLEFSFLCAYILHQYKVKQ